LGANDLLKSWFGRGLFSSIDKPSLMRGPDEEGMFPVQTLWNISPQFNDYSADIEKINIVFSNPAVLKVFALQCDLFSLGKIKVLKDVSGNPVEQADDPILRLMQQPNRRQSDSQFLWDLMFWYMVGNVYCYVDSDVPENEDNKLIFLEPSKMEWPSDFDKYKDKHFLSKASETELMKTFITYRFEDGSSRQIQLSRIICLSDLSNGVGNWFKGKSRIDALYKVISNNEASLDSTNINIRFAGKYLVAGQNDPKDVTKLPMGQEEKDDIEKKVNGRKQVTAVKSLVDIKRFVENIGYLKLDESFRTSYFLIGSMYNIPKDVLEAYLQGATFENQEKAVARHVSYTLQPKGDDFFGALGRRFGYDKTAKRICIDWTHLPFMQVFEKDRAQTNYTNMQTMTGLLKLGVDINEINELLGTTFKNAKYEQPKPSANPGAN